MRFSVTPASAALASVLALAALATGCSRLTSPVDDRVTALPDPPPAVASAPPAAAPPPPAPAPTPAPTPAAPPEPAIRAAHVLISYKGARMADAKVTRTKDEAKKLAGDIAKRAAKKEDFAALAKKYSDDKGSGANGGDLGEFTRPRMVKPFSDAAFLLKPGEVSGVVESDFGFHVIKRAP